MTAVHPYHRITFTWAEALTLEIEWASGREGPPQTPPDVPALSEVIEELELDPLGHDGVPPLCWRDTGGALFEPVQLREATTYLLDLTVPCTREKAEEQARQSPTWPLASALKGYFRRDPVKRWQDVPGGVRITGTLNFGSYIGVANLALPEFGTGPVRVEVACTKLGYFEDLRTLLDAIAEEAVALLLNIEAPTVAPLDWDALRETNPLALLFNLRRVMAQGVLEHALETILRSPHNVMRVLEELRPIALVIQPALDSLTAHLSAAHFTPGGPLAHLFGGHTPSVLPERQVGDTNDTAENRYVKAFLMDLAALTETLSSQLEKARKPLNALEVQHWSERIQDWLSEPLWRGVGVMRQLPANSQVLQRREGYKDVLATDLTLQLGLRLPWTRGQELADGLDGQLRPISELYEYWCFFVLRNCLRSICGPEQPSKHSLLTEGSGGIELNLRRGAQSRVKFTYSPAVGNPLDISLFYNRSFDRTKAGASARDGSYSARFHPDYSVLIEKPGQQDAQIHWLHFDAKYRLEFSKWIAQIDDETQKIEDDLLLASLDSKDERRSTYKRADLYKMHTYRDALLGTRGSYVLFPGTEENQSLFIRHPTERFPGSPYLIPSVGAFQLRPSSGDKQSNVLKVFLEEVLIEIIEQQNYQEELGFF